MEWSDLLLLEGGGWRCFKEKGSQRLSLKHDIPPPSVAGRNRGWPATGLPECELITKYAAALPGSTLLRGNKTCNHPIS